MLYVYICVLIVKLFIGTSMCFQSAARSLFVESSDDPFLDNYIETVSQMNAKEIMMLPKMDDDEFLQYFLNDNHTAVRGLVLRVDTSVFDALRDEQLKHQTDIDEEWETLMISGPMVVGYMGNLMVLSSKKDFPFQAPPGYVYRYIRYPDSFRATLVQVGTDMYNALMGAHTSMNTIQLDIQQVPSQVKKAMKLITSAKDAMLKSLLPGTLENIGRLATQSAETANSTLLRFNKLQDLLGEIIELSANTQAGNEAEIDRLEEQRLNSTLEQDRIKQSLETIKEQYAQSKASLEVARKKYAEAMAAAAASTSPEIIASGGSKPNLLTTAIGIVFDPVKTVGCLLGGCSNPTYTVDNTKFENAMKVAQLAKKELERAEEIHNQHFLLQLSEQNDLAKIINQMAMLDIAQLSTEEILRLLIESAEQVNLIRDQWGRMIQFFSKLAAQAHSTQQVVVKDFVDVIQQAQTDNLLIDPFEREFFMELLVPSATTIEKGAHLLYTMARTYYAVSSEYMINQIAGIGAMSLLQTDQARQAQLQLTLNNTVTTSLQVTQMAKDRHALYLQEMENRQAEYTTYINNLQTSELQENIGK
ncbi:unnamed protein product [Adineta ricciae]|uniref:Uncharacterized protein n=1 Tax=Adineta ricciae TaxID=249248 RepID=A0A815W4Q0_ADIRI|nr:unnamed protein product [Adineta ricciae]